MKKEIVLTAAVMTIFLVSLTCCSRGKDLSKYDVLKKPRITSMSKQKMIIVEVSGDPNETGKEAFGALFKTYWKLKKQVGGLQQVAPRARWPKPLDTPKSEWVGIYGLPVPEAVKSLPEKEEDGPKVELEYWEYGEVAEILHVGPYSAEEPMIKKLHKFIEDKGYEIAGAHEEEYVKGPGMFFKGNPEEYKTIIRYPVKKR